MAGACLHIGNRQSAGHYAVVSSSTSSASSLAVVLHDESTYPPLIARVVEQVLQAIVPVIFSNLLPLTQLLVPFQKHPPTLALLLGEIVAAHACQKFHRRVGRVACRSICRRTHNTR